MLIITQLFNRLSFETTCSYSLSSITCKHNSPFFPRFIGASVNILWNFGLQIEMMLNKTTSRATEQTKGPLVVLVLSVSPPLLSGLLCRFVCFFCQVFLVVAAEGERLRPSAAPDDTERGSNSHSSGPPNCPGANNKARIRFCRLAGFLFWRGGEAALPRGRPSR